MRKSGSCAGEWQNVLSAVVSGGRVDLYLEHVHGDVVVGEVVPILGQVQVRPVDGTPK